MESLVIQPPRITQAEHAVIGVIRQHGFVEDGAWFYPPGGASSALVRLTVFGGQYQVWRRRHARPQSFWQIIVTDDVTNFDQEAFGCWRETHPLSC